jgi:hypothetical protein
MQRNFNAVEAGMAANLDPKSKRIPDSIISRSPEQAMQSDIELLAIDFAKKEPKMRDMILQDLHRAQNGLPEHAAEARKRLAKGGIPQNWPVEILALLEVRFAEAMMQVTGPDYQKDPKYKAFHNLFDESKKDSSVN